MLIPSNEHEHENRGPSLSRRVNANSQREGEGLSFGDKLIKKGEC